MRCRLARGHVFFGADASDFSGASTKSAGDVNGDGFDDLVIGAFLADGINNTRNNAGESFLIFGGPTLPATIDFSNLGTAGIRIIGAEAGDVSSRSVKGRRRQRRWIRRFDHRRPTRANGLGNAKPDAGETYVIFGSASLPATINMATVGVMEGSRGALSTESIRGFKWVFRSGRG